MHKLLTPPATAILLSVEFICLCGFAMAQPANPSEESDTLVLEEVVVTARRREEGLQESPNAVTALSERFLNQIGATTFEDFAINVPSLSYVGNNAPENKIVLRGVSTGVASRDEGSVIGLYFDDVPVGSQRFNPDLRLYDIERVEVLRGPQGTLFGEGSIGGTLRLVTNKPDLQEFGGFVQMGGSNTHKGGGNHELVGVANVPIVEDKFAFRLVGYLVDDSGFVDNVTLNERDVNQTITKGQRLVATFVPNGSFSMTGSIIHQDMEVDGKAQYDPGLGDLQQARELPEALADEFTLANITFSVDLGRSTLDSSTAYFDRSVVNLRDITPLLGVSIDLTDGRDLSLDDLTEFESIVQEFRITSNRGLFNDSVDWLVGVYYRDDKQFFRQDAQSAALGGDALDSDNFLDRKQLAVFGEFDWRISDRATATFGVRWFDIDQEGENFNGGPLAGIPPGVIDVVQTDSSEDGVSPKFRFSYDINDDVLLYLLASRGFREGGPTGEGVPPDPETGAIAPTQFDSDALWNYEFGFKSSFASNRVVLNGAVFYIDWDDIQTNFVRSDGFTYTVNAGAARSQGVEAELRALVSDGLELFLTASFVDSTLTEDQLPPGDGVSGDRIPGVPEVTYSAGLNYTRSMFSNVEGFFNLSYQHVGDSFNGFGTSTGISGSTSDKQGAYDLSNLRFGLRGDVWQGTVFVNNLTDERAVLYFNRLVGDVRVNTVRPRTIGLQLKLRF